VSMLYHIKKRHQMHSMFIFQITPRFSFVHTHTAAVHLGKPVQMLSVSVQDTIVLQYKHHHRCTKRNG
jgi:hypothetical protein